LAQEISYFASHYFESHVLSSNNRVDRNDDLITKNATQPTLSVFKLSGRSYGKKKGNIRWLDDKEVVAAQLLQHSCNIRWLDDKEFEQLMSPPANRTPVTSSSTVGNGDNDHQIWIVPEEDG